MNEEASMSASASFFKTLGVSAQRCGRPWRKGQVKVQRKAPGEGGRDARVDRFARQRSGGLSRVG